MENNKIKFLKKDLIVYLLVLLFTIFISFFWESISLPFSEINYAESFLINKKINPNTDTLRYVLFVGLPLLLYVMLNSSIQYNKINFSLKETNNYIEEGFFDYKVCIAILVLSLFIIIDFFGSPNHFVASNYPLDPIHDGEYLTPTLNFFSTKGLWSSSATAHGGADFIYSIILWKLTGLKTIGSAKIYFPILILSIKLLSIILAYQITRLTLLEKGTKFVFFIIFSIFLISLSHYDAPINYSPFSYRDIFTILFLIFFIEIFLKNKNLYILNSIIAFIAFISLIFHFDVGAYLYALLFLYTFYLIIIKKFNYFFLIYFLLILFWSIFIYIVGIEEFYNLIENFLLIIGNMDLGHAWNYPTPFFSIGEQDGTRATKGLLFQILAGILILKNTIFTKDNFPRNYKILLLFIFFLCLIVYKNALGRSDGYHIKASSDIQYIIIIFFLLKFLLNNFEKKFKNYRYKTLLFNMIPILLFCVIFFNNFLNIKTFKNVLSAKERFLHYINLSDEEFIKTGFSNPEHLKKFLVRFNDLNKDEKCVQNFTSDLILPYLLKKPSCNKYFYPSLATSKSAQLKNIEGIIASSPIYIIYEAPWLSIDLIPMHKRLKLVDAYIKANYAMYDSFNGYTILKKND